MLSIPLWYSGFVRCKIKIDYKWGEEKKRGCEMGRAYDGHRRGSRKEKLLGLMGAVCILLGGLLIAGVLYRNSVSVQPAGTYSQSPGSGVPAETSSRPENAVVSTSSEVSSSQPEKEAADIFSQYKGKAAEILTGMTLQEKVGQVFVFLCPTEGGEEMIKTYSPGGICLNAGNFQGKTKSQVAQMMAEYQSASKIPLLTCCDEEGGTVTRISRFPALRSLPFQSPRQVYASGGMEAIRSDTTEKAQLLKSLGINTNLAPVADLSGNQQDFIYDRSFGDDPAGVSEFVRVSVETYSENGMACVLKHFPGYGNNGDTHTGLTWDKRPYSEFQTRDFLPFQAGFEVGAPIVLVNHNIVECMDPERPATLSAEVHRVLREELGFGGLIMTDDLEMEAIPQYTAGENPAPQAFLAGNDLLLCSEPGDSFHALLKAVGAGEIAEEQLDASVLRILEWKCSMGLL